jgi:hypothetical protein
MDTKLLANPTDPSACQQAICALLAEKKHHSGSRFTVESYSRLRRQFFGQATKTLDLVTSPDVLGCAHCIGLIGRRRPGGLLSPLHPDRHGHSQHESLRSSSRAASADSPSPSIDLGERPMKGFEQPVRVWSARWA